MLLDEDQDPFGLIGFLDGWFAAEVGGVIKNPAPYGGNPAWRQGTPRLWTQGRLSIGKAKMHDVPVLDEVILAFEAHFTGLLGT